MSLLLAVLLLPIPSASAWSALGHRVVGEIAEKRLSPAASRSLRELLGPKTTLAEISACADEIKRRSVSCGPVAVKADPRSKSWHYIDIPIQAVPRGGLKAYCRSHGRESDCVTEQLKLQLKALQDPGSSRARKQLALIWIVHLAADIHQPLHAADDADAGGNAKLARFLQGPRAKKASNLHRVWDAMLYADSALKTLRAPELAARLTAGLAPQDALKWSEGELIDRAALESFVIAKTKIYPAYAESGAALGSDYQEKMQPIALERLQTAGVRLAELLNRALAPAES